MSEDPENTKNQEGSPPSASDPIASTPDKPMLEASTPEVSAPEAPMTETPGPEASAPDVSRLEASDTGEGLISDFRQSLVELEANETAENVQKEKKPGVLRRITGMLTRKTGKLDDSHLTPTTDSNTVQDQGLPSESLSNSGNTVPLIEGDLDIPEWAVPDAQNAPQYDAVPTGSISNAGNTASQSESELDRLWAAADAKSSTQSGATSVQESKNKAFEPSEPAQLTGETQTVEAMPEHNLLESDQPQLEPMAAETADPGEEGHEPAVQNLSPEESLLGGLEPNPVTISPFIESSETNSQPDQPKSETGLPRQSASLWRRVTDFLKPPVKSLDEPAVEVIPDEQISDRLNTGPLAPAPAGPSISEIEISEPQPVPEEQVANPETISQVETSESQPTEVPSTLNTYQAGESQPADEEDRAIWSAYVDIPTNDQAQSFEPSPFVDDSITQLTMGSAPADDSAQTPAFEQAKPDSGLPASDTTFPNSEQGGSPFLIGDSPWLGELRGAIDADDDLSAPFPEPEIETPPEKSDIWDRLVAEEKRSEQPDQATQAAEKVSSDDAANFWKIPTWAAAQEEPGFSQESETQSKPESQVAPAIDEQTADRIAPPLTAEGPANRPGPFWSQTARDESTDGYGSWFEEAAEEQSDLLGLPEPSEEAKEELKESTRLYDSIFEDKKQQEMRSMLLGEEVSQEGMPAVGPMPDFTEEAGDKPKSRRARLTKIQIAMISVTAVVLIALAAVTGVYLFHRTSAVVATQQPAAVLPSGPNGPYPIGIQLTGGWIFSLSRSTMVQGLWTPKSGEWLDGTQVRRVVALPWGRQSEAVIRSFQPGDEINLFFNNKQAILYKVSEVKQLAVNDVSVLSDTRPSLVVILYQPGAAQRWVVVATQQP